jgi:prevent-host-death family protein
VVTNVTTLEVRERLGDLLNRVALRHDRFVIMRRGKPLAAMVPVEKLEQMEALAGRYILEILERQRGTKLGDEEADRIADEAKHRTRPRRARKRRRR